MMKSLKSYTQSCSNLVQVGVRYTYAHNWESQPRAPIWAAPGQHFFPVPYAPGTVVIVDIRTLLNISQPSSLR